jgi:uncharacterized protein involved in exopolysaccharide biosynthesis
MSNLPNSTQQEVPADLDDEDEISIIDLLTVLGENKWKLFFIPLFCSIIAGGISFVLTPSYNAKAVFVNSSKPSTSQSSQLLDQLGGGLGGAAGGLLGPNAGDVLVGLLQSNNVRDQLIDKFNLIQHYEKKNLEETRQELVKRFSISSDKKSSLIAVNVKDDDPKFAAELANAHLEALRKLQKRLSKEEAQQRRDYFEQQIEVISQKPFRDPFIQTALMNSLIRQYETARMDESRDSLVIQVVDPAIAPIKRTTPKRAQIVLVTGAITLFLTMLWIFIRSAMRNAASKPEEATRIAQLKKAWWFFKK